MAGVGRPKGLGKVPGSGRKKGYVTPAVDLRNSIIKAYEEVGGHAYLVRQADENPVAFMALIGKVLPKQLDATIDGGIVITSITRKIVDANRDTDSTSV